MGFGLRKIARMVARELQSSSDGGKKGKDKSKQAPVAAAVAAPNQVLHPVPLPLPLPLPPRQQPPWHVTGRGFGPGQASLAQCQPVAEMGGVQTQALRVDYVPGAVGSDSGFGFQASPSQVFPANEAALSYLLYLPADFDCRLGGKLPGIFIGSSGATGGNWQPDSGSVRVVFKPGNKAVAYVYFPTQVCGGCMEDAVAAQCPEYCAISHATKKMGHHVWKDGSLRFRPGAWNFVRLRVRLNTPGMADGLLELEVNEHKESFDKMVWRTDPQLFLGGTTVVTFFGGSSAAAAAPPGAFCMLKDFVVWGVAR